MKKQILCDSFDDERWEFYLVVNEVLSRGWECCSGKLDQKETTEMLIILIIFFKVLMGQRLQIMPYKNKTINLFQIANLSYS